MMLILRLTRLYIIATGQSHVQILMAVAMNMVISRCLYIYMNPKKPMTLILWLSRTLLQTDSSYA